MSRSQAIDWQALCVSMRSRLQFVAGRVLRDEHEAEDATQEALLAAWRGADRLRDPDALEGWLLRVARNIAVDRLRRVVRRRCAATTGRNGLVDSGHLEPADHRVLPPGARLIFEEVVAALSPALRRTVDHDVRGLSLSDVAASEGITIIAAKTRRSRARARIRQALEGNDA